MGDLRGEQSRGGGGDHAAGEQAQKAKAEKAEAVPVTTAGLASIKHQRVKRKKTSSVSALPLVSLCP